MEIFYTYIIESLKNHNWYIGHTHNIHRRLVEHNSGQNKSTMNIAPWELIFLMNFDTNVEANRFEIKLKKIRNKDFIRKEYSDFFLVS
ncbi:MAG: GIY-YIG nuclease family protein [Ignavibacteriales bacterium]|nr:GIY-YIG nuclease family protein [Ignavibacteriales bacterium]